MAAEHLDICTRCGLCCDGTLFKYAVLDENEKSDPRFRFDISHDEDGVKTVFNLPCCYLRNKICSIYNERPYAICASFRCELLKSVDRQETSIEQAESIVHEVIHLRMGIEKNLNLHFPQINESSLQLKLDKFEKFYSESESQFEFRKKYGFILLSILALRKIFTNSFHGPKN